MEVQRKFMKVSNSFHNFC